MKSNTPFSMAFVMSASDLESNETCCGAPGFRYVACMLFANSTGVMGFITPDDDTDADAEPAVAAAAAPAARATPAPALVVAGAGVGVTEIALEPPAAAHALNSFTET